MERDLTTGSIGKTIAYFSVPYLLSYLLQTLYGMADLFIIGQFCGVESMTAAPIGSVLSVIVCVIAMRWMLVRKEIKNCETHELCK